MDIGKSEVFVLGMGTGLVIVYVGLKLYRNRLRESIASSVTSRVSTQISTIFPGVSIGIDPATMSLIQSNVSYPIADGVLDGLGL